MRNSESHIYHDRPHGGGNLRLRARARAGAGAACCGACLGLRAEAAAARGAALLAAALRAHAAAERRQGAGDDAADATAPRYAVEVSAPPSQALWTDLARLAGATGAAGAAGDAAAAFKAAVREKLRAEVAADDAGEALLVLDGDAPVTARLSVRHAASDMRALDLLRAENLAPGRKRKRAEAAEALSRARLAELAGRLKKRPAEELAEILAEGYTEPCEMDVTLTRAPVFVQGRYRKLARGVSQTPWLLKGDAAASVESLIAPFLADAAGADAFKFHSAGREDVDVRMLGGGRPFVVELENAARVPTPKDLASILLEKINADPEGRVEVADLAVSDRTCMDRLREGALSKKKQYTCLVWTAAPMRSKDLLKLDTIKDLVVTQRTPLRVLHRRSALDRAKTIHSMACEPINEHFFILRLVASAGTYIKEFVHGDFGRTRPSVGSLLACEADILQLDVEELIYQ